MDVQSAKITHELEKFEIRQYEKPKINEKQIELIIELLQNAKRPIIISGQGVRIAGAIELLTKLVKLFKIPVVTPYLGIDTIRHDEKSYIGKVGVKGERAANLAMQNSDLILSIGSSLHVSVIGYNYKQFARVAKKIVVDIDEITHKKKTINIDQFVHADAKDFLNILLKKSTKDGLSNYASWLEKCNEWKNKYPTCLPDYKNTNDQVNSYFLIDQICKNSKSGDIFVSDAGGTFYAVSQAITLTKPNQRYIPSSAMATMGYSLPAAIGISVATGERVIAFTGDGSLQQNIQEFQTLVEYNLPVKLFVLNNDGYHSIRTSQKNYYDGRYIGESSKSGISFPDTVKIAEAYGIKAFRINQPSQIADVLNLILDYDGPVVCDVIVPREQEIVPTVASRINDDGTMSSRPLEDMYPFLDREEYQNNMFIDEV